MGDIILSGGGAGSGTTTVTGTVTADQGAPNSTANRWPVQITDGTDLALVTAAGEVNVLATAQPGVDVGDVTVNNAAGASAVNIQDGGNTITVDNAALSVVGGGTESTALRVTIANDSTGVLSVDDNGGSLTVDGTVTITHGKTIKTVSGSLTSDTDVITAVTSKRIKVIAYSFLTFGTTATTLLLKSNGAGGTEVWRVILQSVTSTVMGANLATSAPSFLFATAAGEKLTADTNTTDTIHYSITYFDDDAA